MGSNEGRVYAPAVGSGWVRGAEILQGVERYRTPLDEGWFLQVTVAEHQVFVISRVRDWEYEVPDFADMARIERDFGVHGWSIQGTMPVVEPAYGLALAARAVDPKGEA